MKEKVQMLRNFRIFADSSMKDYAIETIFEFMKSQKERLFMRGQMIYDEGAPIDGIYFITSGDFEITQKIKAGSIDKELRFKASKTAMDQADIIGKSNVTKLMQLKSRTKSGMNKLTAMQYPSEGPIETLEIMRIAIISQYEVIGLAEITDGLTKRFNSIKCVSEKGTAYFMSRAQLQMCYSKEKFQDSLIKERKLQSSAYLNRMVETFDFQRTFNHQQCQMLRTLKP